MVFTQRKTLLVISVLIAIGASIAASLGILSDFGDGSFIYESIRGQAIEIYGKGIYQHMSSDVAIQGIAQDYVTLFIAVPLLIISLIGFYRGSLQALFVFAGTLGYFFVTYLFYLAMAMYNMMFLVYAALLGLSFFGLFLSIRNIFKFQAVAFSTDRLPYRFAGWFLIINSVLIAILWGSLIIPPLLDGSIYPPALQHYTTLIVQGFDLGALLPISFVLGVLFLRKSLEGVIYGTIYIIFLALLMSALSAKIIAMGLHGVNIVPAVFIIPTINMITIFLAIQGVRRLQ